MNEAVSEVPDVDSYGESSIRVNVRSGDVPNGMGFDRPYPARMDLVVTHYDDYGILVTGTFERVLALRALKKAGYPPDEVKMLPWRPTMVDQEESVWPFGLWVGGKPAVAFYFDVGPH